MEGEGFLVGKIYLIFSLVENRPIVAVGKGF
jgi:hypothetical protein